MTCSILPSESTVVSWPDEGMPILPQWFIGIARLPPTNHHTQKPVGRSSVGSEAGHG